MSKIWTPDEDRTLINGIRNQLNYAEVAEQLVDRSRSAVRHRWNRIKNRLDSAGEFDRTIPMEDIPATSLAACVFDIEVMDFASDGYQDHLVCCSFLKLEEDAEPYTISIKFEDERNDKRVLVEILKELAKYDILIGHNIAGFDLNWLNSRAMYYGLKMPKSWIRYDTYQVAKAMSIKAARKSLGALCTYFGIDSNKTSVQKTEWSMVDSPVKAEFDYALENIVTHCEHDVLDNRELFYILWEYDPKKSFKKSKW